MRAALARNLALVLMSAFVFARASDAAAIAWPGVPTAGDALPAALTFGALAAAALAAWRASTWLGRGRRA